MLHHTFEQDSHGREGTIARIRFLYGDSITVIKGKASAKVTGELLIGRVLDCTEFESFFGDVIYSDWGGLENRLNSTSQLLAIESNKASSYFIFQPI
jgi:hypothetical protein